MLCALDDDGFEDISNDEDKNAVAWRRSAASTDQASAKRVRENEAARERAKERQLQS